MSYTVEFNPQTEIARLTANLDNVVRRHCKIGKVVAKTRPFVPGGIPPSAITPWVPTPLDQRYPPFYIGNGTVMDHPRNCRVATA